jgi:hypothetical protein
MNIKLPGRKATIATGVVTWLLALITEGKFEGSDLVLVLAIITLITVAYMLINYAEKTILPAQDFGDDTNGTEESAKQP